MIGALTMLTNHEPWTVDAACRDYPNPDLFFSDDVEHARSICLECPVMLECRRYALRVREPHGVFGAMTEKERKNLLKTSRTGRPQAWSGATSPATAGHGTEAGAARHRRRGEKVCDACRRGQRIACRERELRRAQ